MSSSPQFPVDVGHVRQHYDRLSSLYRLFWGEHLHHGYFEANESPRRAQIQLMERLADRAAIPRGARVLDIGCGLGGSAFWLADRFGCDVTGMTISPVQARMASKKSAALGLRDRVRFEVRDANRWQPEPDRFDVVWIMESSEHFPDKPGFFERCARTLKPGGTLAVCAWLRRDVPMSDQDRPLIAAIAKAMMSASLDTLSDYRQWMSDAGLTVTTAEDITRNVAPTWTHCARIGANPVVRLFLPLTGSATREFVRAFPLMVQAYAQGAMAFGLFVAKKPATGEARQSG
jgi:tocopherol O-methyltransferase